MFSNIDNANRFFGMTANGAKFERGSFDYQPNQSLFQPFPWHNTQR